MALIEAKQQAALIADMIEWLDIGRRAFQHYAYTQGLSLPALLSAPRVGWSVHTLTCILPQPALALPGVIRL